MKYIHVIHLRSARQISYGRDSTSVIGDLQEDDIDDAIIKKIEVSDADLFEQRVQMMI